MRLHTITPPTAKPVTLAEAWAEVRIDPSGSPPSTPDDGKLTLLIAAATDYAEQATRRALCQQGLRLTYGRFPQDRMLYRAQETLWNIPGDYDIRPRHLTVLKPNLLTLTSVQYYDQQNVLQTLDPASYVVHNDAANSTVTSAAPATIELLVGWWWPITYIREDAVQMNYTAGYSPLPGPESPPVIDYAANVPAQIKQAILTHVRMHYDSQTKEDYERLKDIVDNLLASFRVFNF
jgi:hypothetical protein